jgi:hypothetical protein
MIVSHPALVNQHPPGPAQSPIGRRTQKTAVEFASSKNYRPAMRVFLLAVFLIGSLGSALAADAVTGRVIKMLPFLLDQQGRDSTSPSLFDRDAYQARLREHLKDVSGVRFDVQWKAVKSTDEKLKIRVEARGVSKDGSPRLQTFEAKVSAGRFNRWTKFTLTGDEYKKFGSVVAWRATLWNGDTLLGEQKSFLW